MASKTSKAASKAGEDVSAAASGAAGVVGDAGKAAGDAAKKKKGGLCGCFGGKSGEVEDDVPVGGVSAKEGGGYTDPSKGFAIPKGYTRFKNIDDEETGGASAEPVLTAAAVKAANDGGQR